MVAIELIWQLAREWEEAWEQYKFAKFRTMQIEEMETTANQLLKKLTRLSKELKDKNWGILDHTRQCVDKFRRTLPLIVDLKNPALRDRHWSKVKATMDQEFDQEADDFTLNAIAGMHMQNFVEQIGDISNTASMEFTIELVDYIFICHFLCTDNI